MVVEGAAGDAGGADDLLGADAGVAALGEEAAGGGHQRAAGRLGALGLGSPFYIHTVCMLSYAVRIGQTYESSRRTTDEPVDDHQRQEIDLTAGRIRYREAGEGKPIVFVHGYLVDGRLWDGVVDRSPTASAASPRTGRSAPSGSR